MIVICTIPQQKNDKFFKLSPCKWNNDKASLYSVILEFSQTENIINVLHKDFVVWSYKLELYHLGRNILFRFLQWPNFWPLLSMVLFFSLEREIFVIYPRILWILFDQKQNCLKAQLLLSPVSLTGQQNISKENKIRIF